MLLSRRYARPNKATRPSESFVQKCLARSETLRASAIPGPPWCNAPARSSGFLEAPQPQTWATRRHTCYSTACPRQCDKQRAPRFPASRIERASERERGPLFVRNGCVTMNNQDDEQPPIVQPEVSGVTAWKEIARSHGTARTALRQKQVNFDGDSAFGGVRRLIATSYPRSC